MSNVKPFARAARLPQLTENQRQQLAWLQKNFPEIYQRAMEKSGIQLQEVGDIDWSGIFNNVVNTVKEAAPSLLKAKAEYATLKENLKRMKANQPPVDAGAYLPAYTDTSYQGYQPQVAIKNYLPLILGGVAIVGLFLLLRKK